MLRKLKRKIKKKLSIKEVYTEKIPVMDGSLLAGKVALITGGSAGIGFGIAQAFVRQGAKVIITGRNEERLKEACVSLNKIGSACANFLVWDHSDVKIINDKMEEFVQIFGQIDILVNNAGYHGNQDFFTITEEDFDNTFDVNVKNVFFMSQAVVKYMIDNKIKGNVLNIVSAASMKPAWAPYGISKWACRGFTRGLAREVAPYEIVVNGIAPGPTATDMSHWHEGESISWPSIPKGRMASVEEIGNLAVYLCSDMGKFIIGETVFCDGGSGTLTVNK